MSRGYTSIRKRSSYKPKRRKSSLSASNWWPLFKLLLIIVLIVALLGAIVYLLLPNVLPYVGVEFYPPGIAKPTPEPTPEPTPTPHPLSRDDLSELHNEIVVSASQYKWFGDPYYYGDSILFTAGEIVQGATRMTTLFVHDMNASEGALTKLSITLKNDHFMYPAMNDSWLVYLDAKAESGGIITVYERNGAEYSNPREIKQVYAGHPHIFLWDNYIAWTERTGSSMDKLFLCDLETMESVTVQMFERSYFGTSLPHLNAGLLVWADVDAETSSQITSRIHTLDIKSGTSNEYSFGMYAHDPKTDGKRIAWMDGNHDTVTGLYVADITDGEASSPTLVAEGVVDYFMGDGFLAYSKGEQVWIYIFAEQQAFALTRDVELAQLLNADGDVVMWMDVTSRARDVVKYARIPK